MNNAINHFLRTKRVVAVAAITIAVVVATYSVSLSSSAESVRDQLETEFAAIEETVLLHESLIADCMQSRGHDYVVEVPADFFVEREATIIEATGHRPDTAAIRASVPERANDSTVRALGAKGREAWLNDLLGTEGGADAGCFAETFEAAWDADPNGPASAEIGAMELAVETDPRVVSARDSYIECMSDEGYLVTNTTDVFQDFMLRRAALPEGSVEAAALDAEKQAAFAAHDSCIDSYRAIEEAVRQEYIRENQIQP